MHNRTVSLSFELSASCDADLPTADQLRRYLSTNGVLPEDAWLDGGAGWAIESIGVGPQPQAVNADLLAACEDMLEQQERDYHSDDDGIPESGKRARAAIAAATPTPTTET